ncbi:MAG: ABC transporter permease [Malacoplasma sp.]|nr:ABC transporter permease [Malacoplasma sp.]
MLRSISLSSFLSFLRKTYIYFILILIYVPLLFIVALSFNGQSIRGNIDLNFGNATGENWELLFTDTSSDGFLQSLLNSFLVVILVTPISVTIGLLTSFGMWYAKSNKVRKLIKSSSSTNISIPDIIAGISLSLLFATVWLPLGLDFGYATVVISHISFTTPYAIVSIYPRMASLNKNLIDASNDLGASKLRTFFKVIVPYVSPSIIAASIIVAVISFDDFVITLLVSGNFRTVSTNIYLSSKGIKAWIITFGALLVLLFIAGTFVLMTLKIIKEKRGGKLNWKKT